MDEPKCECSIYAQDGRLCPMHEEKNAQTIASAKAAKKGATPKELRDLVKVEPPGVEAVRLAWPRISVFLRAQAQNGRDSIGLNKSFAEEEGVDLRAVRFVANQKGFKTTLIGNRLIIDWGE